VNCIDISYAGGEKGMVLTWKMIHSAAKMLKPGGSLYLFLIKENNVQEII
jgi:16S rRNA G1207 methylase RsmC